MKARVLRSSQREFDCLIIDSNEKIKATALGQLLKDGQIVVGDLVEVSELGDDEYQILKVYECHSEIYRLLIREKKKKVTASNCDLMVIVTSVSKPTYKRGIIDRFLARAHQWNITPLVVFNKMDQYDPSKFDIKFESDRLKGLNVDCFELSALNHDYLPHYLSLGLNELKERLSKNTAIFLGQSGVGKSHLISTVSGGEVALKSQKVGKKRQGDPHHHLE